MDKQTAPTERAELSASQEKSLIDRTKRILSLLKSDRWLAVAIYGSLTAGHWLGTGQTFKPIHQSRPSGNLTLL